MTWLLDILRGMVIGLANVIPGVSGGTMMVSMGIYDKIIYCINHIVKEFKKSIKILMPYLIGMVLAIVLGAVALKVAFDRYPLPTNVLFIGLILGSIPIILKQMKGVKINALSIAIFAVFAALVIIPKAIANNGYGAKQAADLDIGHVIIYFLLGVIASASMVIPGISGSMMLKIFGYYETIVTDTLGGTFKDAIPSGDWSQVLHNLGVLLPFAIGIVVGIFGVAKLIEFMLKRWKGYTYCAILGMVAASPVVILMDQSIYEGFNGWILAASIAALILGVIIAFRLGGDPENETVSTTESNTEGTGEKQEIG